jgi:hypothetical protein
MAEEPKTQKGATAEVGTLWDAVHATLLCAWNLLDGTQNNASGVNQADWDALSAAMKNMGALVPETERPFSPSYAVRYLRTIIADRPLREEVPRGTEQTGWKNEHCNGEPEPDKSGATLVYGPLTDIAAERQRQIKVEGYDHAHDDDHSGGDLGLAAMAYISCSLLGSHPSSDAVPGWWPWEKSSFRSKGRRQDLVRAAALVVAAIERLDRSAPDEAK